MAPRRFRTSRLTLIMKDPTRMAEVIVAVCNVVVPSVAFASGAVVLPGATATFLWHFFLSDTFIGVTGLLLGGLQIWGAGTDWIAARAWIATIIFALLIALVTAYFFTGFDHRPTVPLMIGTVFAEMFLAWRCWHEKQPSNSEIKERQNGSGC